MEGKILSYLESSDGAKARLLLLHPDDNVLIALGSVAAGESIHFDGEAFEPRVPLGLGHKIARCPIARGELVKKYGAPIGYAGADIGRGEHVHLHNLVSRYTAIEDMDK